MGQTDRKILTATSRMAAVVAAAAALAGPMLPIASPFESIGRSDPRLAILPEGINARAIGTIRRDRRDPKRKKPIRWSGNFGKHGRNCLMMVKRGVPHFLAYGLPPDDHPRRRSKSHAVGTGSAQMLNHRP